HRVVTTGLKTGRQIDGARSSVPAHNAVRDPPPHYDAAVRALRDRDESIQTGRWVGPGGGRQMRERQPEPAAGVCAPDPLSVCACVDLEDVRNPRRGEFAVKRQILRAEPGIAAADVEAEERRVDAELMPQTGDGVVQVRAAVALSRAKVERLRSAWISRMEVAAPRLDHPEAVQVVECERNGSVPTGGQADDCARPAIRDRAEVAVDVRGELA